MTGGSIIVHASIEHGAVRWGGIATAVELAARGTVADGLTTYVVCPGSTDALEPTASGYEVRTVNAVGSTPDAVYHSTDRLGTARLLSEAMFASIEGLRADRSVRLLVHNEDLSDLLVLAKSAAWCESAMVFSHGLVALEHPGRRDLIEQQEMCWRRADFVLVASDAQRASAERLAPGTRFGHLPLPLEILNDEMGPLRQARSERRRGLLVASGRAVRQKGLDILLDAVASVDPDLDFELRIFAGHGDPAEVDTLKKLADALGPRVRWEGWRSRDALLEVVRIAHAVVVPSRFEPLGLVAAEGMALNAQVVATKVGGLGELLDGWPGAVLIDPVEGEACPRSLAEGLRCVLSRPPCDVDGSAQLGRYSVERFIAALSEASR